MGEADTGIVIVVHSLAQAIAALRAAAQTGRAVVLASAPGGGSYVGPGWFGAVIDAAREAAPDAQFSALLDCGDDIGAAEAAIRSKIEGVVFTGSPDVARRLADIARQHGVRLVTEHPPVALDLGTDFFALPEVLERRCAGVLRTPTEQEAGR
jgi:acyl-CoA reductase-like NAD-dependent aldehyde dehydrogenase